MILQRGDIAGANGQRRNTSWRRALRAIFGSTMLVAPSIAVAQDIVPDGLTGTALSQSGVVTDITTTTITQGFGLNSFTRLDVGAGATVNVHVPTGGVGTINIVRERASRIDGTLNSVMGGQVGGTMILANTNGIVIGPDGQVNGARIGLSTPDAGFVAGLFSADGTPQAGHVAALIDGRAPQNPDADVIIDGSVSGPEGVRVRAGRDVVVGSTDARGRAAQVSAVANTGPRRAIVLDGGRDVTLRGAARARSGSNGGEVRVRAGRDAWIEGLIDASAIGNGTGGDVSLLAQRGAVLAVGGVIQAHAPGAGDGGRIAFSGLSTVELRGRMTAAASSPTAQAGEIFIDPEELLIDMDMAEDGQNLTLEASQRIDVRPGVTISTRKIATPGNNELTALPTGPAGNLTLRAPVIEIGEGARLLAHGGMASDGTAYAGGTLRLEATQISNTPGVFTVNSSAQITLGAQALLRADVIEVIATAESRLRADSTTDLINLGNTALPDVIVNQITPLVDELVQNLDTPALGLLPARLSARASIDSRAASIKADSGSVTIRASATTDVELGPDDTHRIGIVAVQSTTTADVTFGSSSVFLGATPQYPSGRVPRFQDISGQSGVLVEALTQETQSLTARGEETGFATGLVISDRQSRARVALVRDPSVDRFSGPQVGFSGDPVFRAQSLRDLTLSATGVSLESGSIAMGFVVSRQRGEALVEGISSVRGGAGGIMLEATTRYDKLHVSASAVQGDASAQDGKTQADAAVDATSRDRLTAMAEGVESGVDVDSAPAPDSTTPENNGTATGGTSLGFAATFLDHDDTTRAEVADTGFLDVIDPTWTFDTPPAPAGDVTIRATLDLVDVQVSAEATVNDSTAGVLAVNLARLDGVTEAVLGPTTISTAGDVVVDARVRLPGHDQTASADMAAIGAVDSDGTLRRAAALPDISALTTADRALFRANVSAPSAANGLGFAASILRGDMRAFAGVAEPQVIPSISGPYFYDIDSLDFPEAFFARNVRITATQSGSLMNQAGGIVPSDAAKSSFGAGIAVTDLYLGTRARAGGMIHARSLQVIAQQMAHVTTLASAGGGPGFNAIGAFAFAKIEADTRADIQRRSPLILRDDPDQPVQDRPAPQALVVRARDEGRQITLSGVTQQTGRFSVGLSAAVNRGNRQTVAAIGDAFDVDYEPDSGVDAGGFYDTRPIVFDTLDSDGMSFSEIHADGASVTATSDAVILAAAAAGDDTDAPEADATKAADGKDKRLRAGPDNVAGIDLRNDDAFADETVQTTDGQAEVEEDRNPAEGRKGGFGFSGAFTSNAAKSRVQAYFGTDERLQSSSSITIQALDNAAYLSLTGALVPQGGSAGVSGAFSHARVHRFTETFVYAGSVLARDGVTLLAESGGRDVIVAGSAAGRGASALSLAGSLALNSGSRTARMKLGAVTIRSENAQVSVVARDKGQVLTVAGAAEAPVDAEGRAVSVGVGLAVAIDRSAARTVLELARFTGRDGAEGPSPEIVLSGVDTTRDVPEDPDVPDGPTVTQPVAAITALATTEGARLVLARSEGQAGRFALAGSVAVMQGAQRADAVLAGNLAVTGALSVRALVAGQSDSRAGADASLPEARGLGVGVAFAMAGETRSASLGISAARVSGADPLTQIESATLVAVVDGTVSARAIGGAAATPPENDEDTDAGEETGDGTGNEQAQSAGSVSLNGSVALNRSTLRANTSVTGPTPVVLRAQDLTLGAQVAASAQRISNAGGKTEAGEGIGIGLGFALITGGAHAATTLSGVTVDGGPNVVIHALQAGAARVDAINGAVEGRTNIGVNIAGIATQTSAVLTMGDLSDSPAADKDQTFATNLTLQARDRGVLFAAAEALDDDNDEANRIVAGLAGIRVTATARGDLGGGLYSANNNVLVDVSANPSMDSRSNGTDALQLDASRTQAQTNDQGEVTRKGAFNLDAAGALTDSTAKATLHLKGAQVTGLHSVVLGAGALLTSSSAGFVVADGELFATHGTQVSATHLLNMQVAGQANVTVTGSRETDKGTQDRAKQDDHSNLLDRVGKALLAGATGEDDEAGDDGESAAEKRSGLSATITPESARATAQLVTENAAFRVTDAAGRVLIGSRGQTDITLGAADAAILGVVAITETNATTHLRDTRVVSPAEVLITSDVVESQTLTARLGASQSGPVDLAGIVSVRDSRSVVLVNNDIGRRADVGLFGKDISTLARTTRALNFDATANSGPGAFLSVGAVVSYGNALTASSVGGVVTGADGVMQANSFTQTATARAAINVATTAQSGDQTTPRPAEADLSGSLAAAGEVVLGLADDVKEKSEVDEKTKSEAKIADAFRLALSLMVAGQTERVETRLGGTGVALSGGDVTLAQTDVTARQTQISTRSSYDALSLRGLALLGESEDADTTETALTVAVSFFGQWGTVRSTLGRNATVTGDGVTITATTALDPRAGPADVTALRNVGANADAGDAFALSPDENATPLGFARGDDWSLSQGAAGVGTQVGVGVDAAIARLNLTTEVIVDGMIRDGSAVAQAQTEGSFTLRTGAARLSPAASGAGARGFGGGVSILLTDERTRALVTQHGGLVATGRKLTLGATSGLALVTLGQSTTGGSGLAFSGALGLSIVRRTTDAILDPGAEATDEAEVTATDNTVQLTAGLAQSVSDATSVGISAGINFGTVLTRALYGRLSPDGTMDPSATALQPLTTLTVTAHSQSLLVSSAAAGAGSTAAGPTGGFSIDQGFSSLIGEQVATFGKTDSTEAAGEADFGLGISGAFAGNFGQALTEARVVGTGLLHDTLSVKAIADDSVLTQSGGIVRGFKVDGIAGAASLSTRDARVTAAVRGATIRDTLALEALNNRISRSISAGTKGFAKSDFAVAGSASLDLGERMATARLSSSTVEGEAGTPATQARVEARIATETTVLAGGDAVGQGVVVGLSYAQHSAHSTALAEVTGDTSSRIHAGSVQVHAVTRGVDTVRSFARATTLLEGMFSGTAAVSIATANITAQAFVRAGLVLSPTLVDVAALTAAEGNRTGQMLVDARRRDLSLATGAAQAGGAFSLLSGSRVIEAEVAGTQIGFTGPGGTGTDSGLHIRAQDSGTDQLRSFALVLGDGNQFGISGAVHVRQGRVAARLGQAAGDGIAPTALAMTTIGAVAQVTALDSRDTQLDLPTLPGGLSGIVGNISAGVVVDTRVVSAIARDAFLFGAGGLRAHAHRSAALLVDLRAFSLSAGGATVKGDGIFATSSGKVTAQVLGSRAFLPGAFGAVSADARDDGEIRARILEGGVGQSAFGAQVTVLDLGRDVVAQVGDSDTQRMALNVSGTISATAHGASLLEGQAVGIGASMGMDAGVTVLSMATDRDVFAAVGGSVNAGTVTVAATREDVLDVKDVAASVSGSGSIAGRFVHLLHGGSTEALLTLNGATNIAGNAGVSATDTSRVAALTFSARVSGGVSVGADILLLRMGGAEALRAGEGTVSSSDGQDLVDTARTGSANAVDGVLAPYAQGQQASASMRQTTVRGETRARVAGAALSVDEATALDVLPWRGTASVGGDLSVTATTDMTLRAVAGQVGVSSGPAVSAGIAVLLRGTHTSAQVDMGGFGATATSGLRVTGATRVLADSKGNTTALPFGVSVGSGPGVSGAFALAIDRRQTNAVLRGGVRTGTLSQRALSNGNVLASANIAGVGGSFGTGIGMAIAIDDRMTSVLVEQAHLTTIVTGQDALVLAQAQGDTFANAVSAGVGSNAGLAYAQAMANRSAITQAQVRDATVVAAHGIAVHALADSEAGDDAARPAVTALVVPVASGGTAGVGAGFATATLSGLTQVMVTNATLTAFDNIDLLSRSNVEVLTLGIGASIGGKAGVGGSISVSTRSDEVSTIVRASTLTADNSLAVVALASTGTEGFAGAEGLADNVPLNEGGNANADVDDLPDDLTEGDGPPTSRAQSRLAGYGLNVAGGGVAGVGLSVGVTTISGSVSAVIDGGSTVTARSLSGAGRSSGVFVPTGAIDPQAARQFQLRRGVVVLADSFVAQTGIAMTAGIGGVAGVAGQVAVLRLSDTVAARIGQTGEARSTVTTQGPQGDLFLRAGASSNLTVVNVVAGGAGKAGVGLVSNTVLLDRQVQGYLDNATVTAGGRMFAYAALAERLRTVDVAGGGALFAGVAGAVTVISGQSDVTMKVDRATLTSAQAMIIDARLTRRLQTTGIGAALGIGTLASAITVIDLQDKVLAEIADAPNATQASQIQAGSLEIAALSDQTLRALSGSVQVQVGGLTGTVLTVLHDTNVRARIGNHAQVGLANARVGTVSVLATNRLNAIDPDTAMLQVGSVGISGFSYGAAVAVLSARAVTEAELGTSATIRSTQTANVQALAERNLSVHASSLAIGLGGAVNVLTALILLGEAGGGADGGMDHLSGAADTLASSDPLSRLADAGSADEDDQFILLPGENGAADLETGTERAQDTGARLKLVASAAAPVTDADRTVARVRGGSIVDADRGVFVSARDLTQARAQAGQVGVGGTGAVLAGYARVRANSTVLADVLTSANLVSATGPVAIGAAFGDAGIPFLTQAHSFAGSGGGVSVNLAFARTETSRKITARLGSGASASSGTAFSIEAANHADTTATTTSRGFALAAAAGMNANVVDTAIVTADLGGTVSAASAVSVIGRATGQSSAVTDAFSLGLGIAGNLLAASVKDSATVIGRVRGTIADAGANVEIRALNARDASAQTDGVAGSLALAIGGSFASLDLNRMLLAEATATASVTARTLVIAAEQVDGDFTARANNGAGALVAGVAGARAIVTLRGTARARLDAAQVNTTSLAGVSARSTHHLTAEAGRTAIGLLGTGGAGRAEVDADFDTGAFVQAAGNIGGKLSLRATTDETLHATAEGRAGGAVGVNGSTAVTRSRSDTVATIGSRGTGFAASEFDLASVHTLQYAPLASSVSITALGFAGAFATADIATDSGIVIAQNARLSARSVTLSAKSTLSALLNRREAVAGSGGVLNGTGAFANVTLVNTNRIRVLTGAHLDQTGRGAMGLTVFSRAGASPDALITTRELASIPVAQADADVTNTAHVVLSSNAVVTAEGRLSVTTGTSGRVVALANADTVAAGSRISAQADATYRGDEQILLLGTAVLEGKDTVALSTGRGDTGESAALVSASATYRSQSVVPLDRKPVARAITALTSAITLETGARVAAAADVRLETAPIALQAQSTARGRNLLRDVTDSILEAVSFDQISFDAEVIGTETVSITENTGSTVNGTVISGRAANLFLRYTQAGAFRDASGAVTTPSEAGLRVTVQQANAVQLRAEVLAELQAERADYLATGQTDLADLMALQIAEVTALLDMLVAQGGGTVEVVRLADIAIEGASIFVDGGFLAGSGSLRPTTDVRVQFINDRTGSLTLVGDISVPDRPGQVVLNGLAVETATNIEAANTQASRALLAGRVADGGRRAQVVDLGLTAPLPAIVSAAQAATSRVDIAAVGDLVAGGAITNRVGLVRLASGRNLFAQGNIIAQSVELQAAQNLIVGLAPGLRSLGPDVQARLFDRANGVSLRDFERGAQTSVHSNAFGPADTAQDAPSIIAANVSVYGQFVNINGRIEAGGPQFSVDLGAGLDQWIDTVLLPGLTAADPQRIRIHNPLDPQAATGITGNIAVYYDTVNDRIEFDPITAQGGQVRIAGNLVSTGNGEVVALDGFANIDIASVSRRALRLDQVDTGGADGVRGRVELIDLRAQTRTVYQGTDTAGGRGILRQTFALPLQGADFDSTGGRAPDAATTLAPDAHGNRVTTHAIHREALTTPYVVYTVRTTEPANGVTGQREVTGATVQDRGAGSSYQYSRTPATSVTAGSTHDHSHAFRADSPVQVRFIGAEVGQIEIAAAAAVQLAGLVRSEGAGLSITAGGDVVGVAAAAQLRAAQITVNSAGGKITGGSIGGGVQTLAVLDGVVTPVGTLITQGLNLSTLFSDGRLTLTVQPGLARLAPTLGLRRAAQRPDAPLALHVTDGTLAPAAVMLNAGHGLAQGAARGDIAVDARDTSLPLLLADGARVSIRARGDIGTTLPPASGGHVNVRSSAGLSLTSADGAIGDGLRIVTGEGVLQARAVGNISLSHAPFDAAGTRDLLVDQVVSRDGNITIQSTGRILDATPTEFSDLVTDAAALSAFWSQTGMLGDERAKRITAELTAVTAATQADFEYFWALRVENGGVDLSSEQLAARIATDIAALGDLPAELADSFAAHRRAAYVNGRALSLGFEATATARPNFVATLSTTEQEAITAQLTVTQTDLDVALRADYIVTTTDTVPEVEVPNFTAGGNIVLNGAGIGQDRLVARLTQAGSAPTAPASADVLDVRLDQLTASAADRAILRDVLALLTTSERADIRTFGSPALRTDIYRAEDVDVQAGGSVRAVTNSGAHTSYDASIYIGSEGDIVINQIHARDRARVKVGGGLSALGLAQGIVHVAANAIVLEAAGDSIGAAGAPIRLDSAAPGGTLDVEARAGGTPTMPGAVNLLRETAGNVVLGAVIAQGDVTLDVQNGNLWSRSTETFVQGANLTLAASGALGRSFGVGHPDRAALNLRATGHITAIGGAGVLVSSDQTMTARSIGANAGRVEVVVTAGDLILSGATDAALNPTLPPVQAEPVLFASFTQAVTGSSSPNDLLINVQNGRVLDAGSDNLLNRPVAQAQVVPDIRAAQVFLFTGGLGTAENVIETDIGYLNGNASAGLYVSNDRRGSQGSSSTNRDRWGLTLGTLTMGQGGALITQRDQMTIRPGGGILAAQNVTLDLPNISGLMLAGNATLNGANVHVNAPARHVSMAPNATLSSNGNLSLALRSIGGADPDNLPLATGAGNIRATGQLALNLRETTVLRDLSGGAGVTITGLALPDQITGGLGPIVPITLNTVTGGGDVSVQTTGNLSLLAATSERGNVTLVVEGGRDYATLSVQDVTTPGTATLRTSGLSGVSLLDVDAARLTGRLGDLSGNLQLRLRGNTLIEDAQLGGFADTQLYLRALDGQTTFAGNVTMGRARIEALSLLVEDEVQGADLTIEAIDGLFLRANTAHIRGNDVTITVGGPLGGDFAARPANLEMGAGARMTAFGTLDIAVTGTAQVSGLQSTRADAGALGIRLSADTILEAGDSWIDLTTRDGVRTELRAATLIVDAASGMETQVGALDVVVGKGDILVREVDDLILTRAITGQGRIDIFSFGDLELVQATAQGQVVDTAETAETLVLTAQGSLYTTGDPVQLGARAAYLGAIDGNLGSLAQPMQIRSSRPLEQLGLFAGRHIVGEFAVGPAVLPLLAADTGQINANVGGARSISVLSTPGDMSISGVAVPTPHRGYYDTLPALAAVLEAARYPLRLGRGPGDFGLDSEGLDALPGRDLPARQSASDLDRGDTPPPVDTGGGRPSSDALKRLAYSAAVATKGGTGLAPTEAGNPLQPFGSDQNRLRLFGAALAQQLDRPRVDGQNTTITIDEELRR